ncbi:hypothetical protein O1611_g5397 [Lasiodiplodia mahajangana]|uniref:Uncharacterized protein n=1 Tax=Lasiodiplodia mahajangana TaxID=1108764 RepID=A0ACC2JLK2_9PEZI|nr:hypothetical protein O1611_g5397 [Lasiodiplodia mahajangana]
MPPSYPPRYIEQGQDSSIPLDNEKGIHRRAESHSPVNSDLIWGSDSSDTQRDPESSQWKPSTPTKHEIETTLQTTISDDRSRGSKFESSHNALIALHRYRADPSTHEQNRTLLRPKTHLLSPLGDGGEGPQREKLEAARAEYISLMERRVRLRERIEHAVSTRQEIESPRFYLNDQPTSLRDALRVIKDSLDIQDESLFTIETLREHAWNIKAIKPRVQLIYRVKKDKVMKTYLDPPQWLAGANSSKEAFVGNLPLLNIPSYLSKHPEILGVVCRDYDYSLLDIQDSDDGSPDANGRPKHSSEAMEFLSNDFVAAIDAFCTEFKFGTTDAASTKKSLLSVPYLPIFHTRGDSLNRFLETLNGTQQQHFQAFLAYVFTEHAADYKLVDAMTSKGTISQRFIKYLFKPGDVVVQGNHRTSRGYTCTTWLGTMKQNKLGDDACTYNLKVWHWEFKDVVLRRESNPPDCQERLPGQGHRRYGHSSTSVLSYYEDDDQGFEDYNHGRYMVDMKMYYELHKGKQEYLYLQRRDRLGIDALKQDDPPDDQFVYLTPPTLKAFNLNNKKWIDLEADKIRPVVWNKQAFHHLVIKEKTKRLIQALISNQIEAANSTDLITSKGNGLVMLLHGGPGTGKTLTAESVAEVVEKPLYPVTCGDIGTEPEAVEKYLESVFHIGKTWDCVVLLDEADVFLEQRSLEDLRRNALVSVFLRVLEYYDGILILTSNRVGTFDEAFKSRIQLALHYKNLSEHQRTRIWGNFISRLEGINEEGIDFADLKDNVETLAKHRLNGREIRNVITTARQYSRWERQQPQGRHVQLNYSMMKEVIETAGEFDQYIEKLNGGHTYDELAEDDRLRLGGDA